MARRHGKVDLNHGELRDTFRALGCSVVSLADLGKGIPDLLVGCSGQNLLVEVKGEDGKLTPDQVEFHKMWRGQRAVARTPQEAITLVERVRQSAIARRPDAD